MSTPSKYMIHKARRPWAAQLTPPRLIALVYIIGIALATALLHLPGVQEPDANLSSIDLLFTATSAICITGLVVTDTGTAFTYFGEILLLIFFQVGGLGIITFGTLFAFLTGRRLHFSERQQLAAQVNAFEIGSVINLMWTIFLYTLVSEFIGFILLAIRFVPQFGRDEGLYQAFYHSISAYNNAGFVVLSGGMSQYASDPLVSLTISGLVILGGLGFIVQLNCINYLFNPKRNRLLVYSKLTLITTAILLVVGMVVILILEWHNSKTLGSLDLTGKLLTTFFQSMTPRSGGFSMIDIESMHTATIFIIIGLMLIGANSGSTGGGIKTSTFAILIGSAWNMIRGRGELVVFKRRVKGDNVVRAGSVTTLYALLVAIAFFFMLATNPQLEFTPLLFETVSAAATVGLSMNTTSEVNDQGLVILSILMYLGRIGPLTFAIAFSMKRNHDNGIEYPYEKDILVG